MIILTFIWHVLPPVQDDRKGLREERSYQGIDTQGRLHVESTPFLFYRDGEDMNVDSTLFT